MRGSNAIEGVVTTRARLEVGRALCERHHRPRAQGEARRGAANGILRAHIEGGHLRQAPEVSSRTVERVLSRLIGEGKVVKIGTYRDARYRRA